ncbi:uncharacterized protein LOC107638787 isoform X1 [Arachis ipaensis]|uniref:uncharacterized protein LOC107638787 isoform X1 n=1 Tax=Arachis ipaensis TaxID=130454 RepID=UPI0007AF0C4A|nr:uncharacterized protein LOC107638787 isoform X1 [Arachis ipaensis]XP_020976338.1 uncharacterized protein LOC107638787 isoform X1 [Arachis ipaensis]XP_020976340.1 uncharacterized protein LOC107638787 isoform X1 [Arachis ipaensis]XP_020976341.1 uncharacterized protein LOC107638787 isoform X1 [Arachis ipaensis]XP_020976342.1 uncharacterized protein LOC107638787 isoform X1 [Arachis ipaensis]XP_025646168.1 uncharacterized protein LOC112741409 [Arachis hypogaea]XP_025646169.1 uncharacterized pro
MSYMKDQPRSSVKHQKSESNSTYNTGESNPGNNLWTDGLICAFEFVQGRKKPIKHRSPLKISDKLNLDVHQCKRSSSSEGLTHAASGRPDKDNLSHHSSVNSLRDSSLGASDDDKESQVSQGGQFNAAGKYEGGHWVPIGWKRILQLIQTVQVDADWGYHQIEIEDQEDEVTVADLAAPYWEYPAGPIWWCHVCAGHPNVEAWLINAKWLHPAVSLALRDESKLISEKMKHLFYEVPVRVAGGLLFELLGQSAGDPFNEEDDIPVVVRSWQAQKFLLTAMHIKGSVSRINVLGITEVQELLSAGGYNMPRTAHDIIAHLACRLSRWDDRLFRKSIFGAADEIELKFMNKRNYEDLNLFSVILNQEIRRLSRQVIRVKWSLHARDEIVFELLQHLKGNTAKSLLEEIKKSTREMIEEQEAVRGRLFTIQDVMQSNVRAWLQDRSLRVTHNLAVFGGVGVVLTIVTGLFGINVDGMPGGENTPYAFGVFAAVLILLTAVLIAAGLAYLGLKKPINEGQVEVRMLELQTLVKMFQHEAETHAQVRGNRNVSRNNLPPTSSEGLHIDPDSLLIR